MSLGGQAALSLAFWAFFLFSFMIVEPTNKPIPESPMTRRNAGSRTAHSRAGKKLCMGLDASKKG